MKAGRARLKLYAKAAALLYDFGLETFGYLDISEANSETELGVYYGESREEAIDTDHTYTFERIRGKCEYRLTQRAFRYIFIKTKEKPLSIQYLLHLTKRARAYLFLQPLMEISLLDLMLILLSQRRTQALLRRALTKLLRALV